MEDSLSLIRFLQYSLNSTRHWAFPVDGAPIVGHPTVKQSPTLMSSRARSPVKLVPDVYLVPRGERGQGGDSGGAITKA